MEKEISYELACMICFLCGIIAGSVSTYLALLLHKGYLAKES